MSGVVLGLTQESYERVKKELLECRRRIIAIATESNKTQRVYRLNLQLFPLSEEMIDHMVMKLRLVRHLRPGSYDEIFGGDPTWVTESIGGRFQDGKVKVTKTSFRFLQTLYNL